MTLVRQMADRVLAKYPGRAATILERVGEDESVRLLARGGVEGVATILQRLSPQFATDVLRRLAPERAAGALAELPVDTAARLVRRLGEGEREPLLARLEARRARSLRAMLRFPEGTAGALMDPDVLALPQELTAREALARVRQAAELARYNLYVVDAQQRLVGALNLRELLIARGRLPLSALMTPEPHRVPATADRATVLAHPGWRDVHALPVVDDSGAYLGAIRYRTLRELEEELLAPRGADADTSAAFGDLIQAAAGGLLDALAGTTQSVPGERHGA